jgi:hypothetical protein
MASYSSYKKVVANDSLTPGVISDNSLALGTRKQFGVRWVFGQPCACSTGCCCLWTVPANVYKMQVEAWGAGGSGHGSCNCNRCHHHKGAGGGYYNSVFINTTPGCQYTLCAGGNSNCCRFECTGCQGCTSFVNGFNLSNFCAIGGTPGCANTDWTTTCTSAWECCIQSGSNGGSFGFGNHAGTFGSAQFRYDVGFCQCYQQHTHQTSAPLINTESFQMIGFCWVRCGCWTVPYGHGGQGAIRTFCGSGCCGQGGMGGPGLVKVTFF